MATELSERDLQTLVYTDELTRIHNLRYFRDRVPLYLDKAKAEEWNVAFFMLDIDDFKTINDNHGHMVGDRALIHFSEILVQKMKPEGLAIRYAGDEFVLIIPKIDKAKAARIGKEIQQILDTSPLKIGQKQVSLNCSIGVSLYPQDGDHLKDLFEKADEALYVAKEQGKSRVVITPESGKLLTPAKLNSILDTPYIVGRETLVEFLEGHLSKKGNPKVFPILMGGEGTGKTRLLKFAREVAQKELDFTLFAKGYPFWQSDMYGAVFSALENLFEQQHTLSDEVFARLDDKYRLSMKPRLSSWKFKEIRATEKITESDSMTLFEALTQTFFILREMGHGAVLLDDVDQIDTPSLQFFGSQFGHREGGQLHFISAIRSPDLTIGEEKILSLIEAMPELTSGKRLEKLQLAALQTEHVQQLAAKLFDGKTLSQETAETLLRNSSGNPLFIVEAISTLLLEGKIQVLKDKWDLSQVKPGDVPSSLHEMLKARLMRLSLEAINILKMAAVLGEKINPQQLARMAKLKVHQVLNALGDAQRALLIEEGPNPDEYFFSHRVSRAVLYSMIDEEEREQYHVRAAELEEEYGGQYPERIVGRLAYHFHNAGKLERAAEMFSALKHQMEAVHISKGTRRILQQRIHSVALAKESSLEDKDLATALMIGRTFRSCMQNLRLYPKENENVRNSLSQFMNHLVPFLDSKTEALALSVTPETILFNSQPLPPYLEDPRLTQDLYLTLNSFGLQGILFLRGISQEEVVDFVEIFKRMPEEVIGQWDVLLERLKISHIFPDRKVFVAVGERRVLLEDQSVHAVAVADEDMEGVDGPTAAAPGPQMTDAQIAELRILLEQFAHEKQELLAGLRSSGISERQMQNLAQMLSHADIGKLADSIPASPVPAAAPPPKATPAFVDRYLDVEPDTELINDVDNDILLAFEDLSSENTRIRAKAAGWLSQQDPFKVAEAGFLTVTADIPIRFRRLAASVVQRAGQEAVGVFLKNLNVGMNIVPLTRVLRVCDVFKDHPDLISTLRSIALRGPVDTIPPIVMVLKKIPGKKADGVLLEIFKRASGKIQWDIIPLFAERKMVEAIPVLAGYIKSISRWDKEKNISLQEEVCRTLGVLHSLEAADALITAAQGSGSSIFGRAKPDSIRAAATWALTQLPRDPKVDGALEKLKNDRSDMVRKAAELAGFFRE